MAQEPFLDYPALVRKSPKLIQNVLARAGWTPDRQMDASSYIRAIEQESYTAFLQVQHFLQRFGGLRITWSIIHPKPPKIL